MAINTNKPTGVSGFVPLPTTVRAPNVPLLTPTAARSSSPVKPAAVSHQSVLQTPVPNTTLTANQRAVIALVDVLGPPPSQIGQAYLQECVQIAALLGVDASAAQAVLQTVSVSQTQEVQPNISVSRPVTSSPGMVSPYGNVNSPVSSLSSQTDGAGGLSVSNAALVTRNNVFDFVDTANAYVSRAASSGITPPANPFVVIASLNASRQAAAQQVGNPGLAINIAPTDADQLISDITAFVSLLSSQPPDVPALPATVNAAAQISSFSLSMDGFGSQGNAATDLMRFLPTADEVTAQADKNLLAAFDFRKRVPVVLFTADYAPDGVTSQGAVVGWKKIPDASGYTITRRGVFDNTQQTVQMTNADLTTAMANLQDYLDTYVLTFYDTVDSSQVWAYLDQTALPDMYYLYRVQAYQVQNDAKDQIFNVTTKPSSFSSASRTAISTTLASLAQQYYGPTATSDTINPWPLVSLQLYGDSRFDWILAAVNARASVNRNDKATTTREFSYLGAKLSDILSFMDEGSFVSPNNVNDVVSNVTTSITQFGVSQTIAEILHETGILYYFEGTPPSTPSGLNRNNTLNVAASPILSGIIAAVDPETATLDLASLSTNLPQILNNAQFSNDPAEVTGLKLGQTSVQGDIQSTPQEISVPPPEMTGSFYSSGDVQYMASIPATSGSVVDLTTYDGISALVRTIRLFVDTGPNTSGQVGTPLSPPVSIAKTDPATATPPALRTTPYTKPSTVAGIPVVPPQVTTAPRPTTRQPIIVTKKVPIA